MPIISQSNRLVNTFFKNFFDFFVAPHLFLEEMRGFNFVYKNIFNIFSLFGAIALTQITRAGAALAPSLLSARGRVGATDALLSALFSLVNIKARATHAKQDNSNYYYINGCHFYLCFLNFFCFKLLVFLYDK